MGNVPERIWATEDTANFGEDRFHSTTPMRGLTEYLRADIAAAREADLRAALDAALARERALLDSNEVNRQALLDANAAHQRQVDSLRAEVERLTQERDEARGRFNDLDLCHMGVAPCQTLISAHDEAARLRAMLDEALEALNPIAHFAGGAFATNKNIGDVILRYDVESGRYDLLYEHLLVARATLAKIGGQND